MSFYPILPWSCTGQNSFDTHGAHCIKEHAYISYMDPPSIALGGRKIPSLCKQYSFLGIGYLFSSHWGNGGTAPNHQPQASSPPFPLGRAGDLAAGFVTLNIYQASGRLQNCAILYVTESWITFCIVTKKKCKINNTILYCAVRSPQITGGGITWRTIHLQDSNYRCGQKTIFLWGYEMQSSWHSFILKL